MLHRKLRASAAYTIAERIRKARTRAGLLQADLADAIGASRVTVVQWEAGRAVPRADLLGYVADATGVTTDWLLGRKD